MKSRIFAVVLSFVALKAHAVPTGCFMDTFSGFCYPGQFLAADCDQWNMTPYYFGNYVASMCSYVNVQESAFSNCAVGRDACNAALNATIAQRDSCNVDFKDVVAIADACFEQRDSCIDRRNSCDTAFNSAIAQRDAYAADKNACAANAAAIEGNRQQWIAYANGRNDLIKRLYRACGAKCRRIK